MLHMTYLTQDRETVNEARKAYKDALSALETAYRETLDETPKKTLCRASETVCPEMLFSVLATLVHGDAWDGRISAASANWAASEPGCLDEQTREIFGIYSNIHRAHLNQLAEAAREYCKIG